MYFQLYNKHEDYTPYSIDWGDTSGSYYFNGAWYNRIEKDGSLQLMVSSLANSNVEDPFVNWSGNFGSANWKIDKLSNTDLWFSFTNNGNIYEMQLNR
jgi:hypothetical protein